MPAPAGTVADEPCRAARDFGCARGGRAHRVFRSGGGARGWAPWATGRGTGRGGRDVVGEPPARPTFLPSTPGDRADRDVPLRQHVPDRHRPRLVRCRPAGRAGDRPLRPRLRWRRRSRPGARTRWRSNRSCYPGASPAGPGWDAGRADGVARRSPRPCRTCRDQDLDGASLVAGGQFLQHVRRRSAVADRAGHPGHGPPHAVGQLDRDADGADGSSARDRTDAQLRQPTRPAPRPVEPGRMAAGGATIARPAGIALAVRASDVAVGARAGPDIGGPVL